MAVASYLDSFDCDPVDNAPRPFYAVGDTLTLPCIEVGGYNIGTWMGWTGTCPLLITPTVDEHYIPGGEVEVWHVHPQWDFVDDALIAKQREYIVKVYGGSVEAYNASLWGWTMTLGDKTPEKVAALKITERPFVCRRIEPLVDYSRVIFNEPLERDFCKALMNGKCPHRGTPKEAMRYDERRQMYVCVGHGLRWNTHGKMVPRTYAGDQAMRALNPTSLTLERINEAMLALGLQPYNPKLTDLLAL